MTNLSTVRCRHDSVNQDTRPYTLAMALRAALQAQDYRVRSISRPEMRGDRMEFLVEGERLVRVTVQVLPDPEG